MKILNFYLEMTIHLIKQEKRLIKSKKKLKIKKLNFMKDQAYVKLKMFIKELSSQMDK